MTVHFSDDRVRAGLILLMVATLPLHTVFFDAWIAWKPFLVALVAIVALDIRAGISERRWPWHPHLSLAVAVFLLTIAVSWSGDASVDRFASLWLATGVGGGFLLVTERALRVYGMSRSILRTVFWSGGAMGLSAVLLSLVAMGVFGAGAIDWINDLPGVFRATKAAYLDTGFIALTNWHQDPGYAAAWMNLWAALSLVAIVKGVGSANRWVDASVVGLLGFGSVMTMSRTGWIGLAVSLGFAGFWLARDRSVDPRLVLHRLGSATIIGLIVFGLVWVTDPADVGGDLDRQVEFRLGQGLTLDRESGLDAVAGDGTVVQPDEAVGDYRTEVWPWYVDAFQANPLRGAGLGTGWDTEGIQEPHNLGLQLAGETGLLGVVGFLVLAAVVARTGSGRVGVIALVAAMTPALTQTVLFEPTIWFAGGIYVGRLAIAGDNITQVGA